MEKIRCAFVSTFMGPYYSNYVASVIACEKAMQEKGCYSVYVYPREVESFDWVKSLREVNDRIYFLDYKPRSVSNFRALKKIFKDEKINLIYSRMCGWDFPSHFAAPRLPIIWHMEMRVIVDQKIKRLKNLFKFKCLAFGKTYHIAVSQPGCDAINSLKPKNPCVWIPNALDFSRLEPIDFGAPVGRDGKPLNLLLFGWDPAVKGLDLALDACEKINTEDVKVRLLVSAQEKTYEYMKNRYGEKNPEWVELLPPTDHIAEVYGMTDIMLSASRSEGFPYAIGESLYTGLSVVYSDIPGAYWTGEFKAVHKFASGDAADLERAIREAMAHPVTAEERKFNRDLMTEKYSMETWSGKILDIIEEIMRK